MDKLRKKNKVKWTKKNDLQFQILDWKSLDMYSEPDSDDEDEEEEQEFKKKELRYIIRLFGITQEGYSVCTTVTGFKPYFFISIPEKWKKSQVQLLVNTVTEQLSKKSNVVAPEFEIVKRHCFRGFTNNALFRYVKLSFPNKRSFDRFRDIFYTEINILGKKRRFDLFESKMDPMLRFVHINNLKAAGWAKVPKKKYEVNIEKISKCQIDITTDWKQVIAVENESIAPLLIASFDIEADSSHGDFPLAKKTYKKLASDVLVHYWTSLATIDKYQNVKNEREKWKKFVKHKLEREEAQKHAKDNVKKVIEIDEFILEAKTDEFIEDKYILVIETKEMIKDENKYFYRLIASAFGMVKPVEGINFIYTKKNKLPSKEVIKSIISEVKYICHFKQLKFKGNNQLKKGVKKVVARMENCKNIREVEYVINDVAQRDYLNILHLQSKVLIKDVLVDFIDDIMRKSFPAVMGDRVIQIGTVVQRYGDPNTFIKHIITLKGCDPIEGAVVVPCKTEKQVLMEWHKFINQLDPDIITGYNIFGFDEIFMYDRACELGCMDMFATLGRIEDEEPKLIEKNLSSSALGDNVLNYIDMTGRVQIDILKVVQRDHKLNSYKLDFVANNFIRGDMFQVGTKSKDKKLKLISEQYKKYDEENGSYYIEIENGKDLSVGNFIYLNPKNAVEQSLDGKKMKIKDIVTMEYKHIKTGEIVKKQGLILDSIVEYKLLANKEVKYCWGLAKDDVHHTDIFRLQKGSNSDRRTIAVYCIQDCALLIHLINKLCIITNNLGMANVCHVPFSYIFLRGQGIKLYSFVGKQCRLDNYLIPDLIKESELEEKQNKMNRNKKDRLRRILRESELLDDAPEQVNYDMDDGGCYHIGYQDDDEQKGYLVKDNDDGYEGAIVIQPHPDIYFEPVSVTDYGSLYPSSMISENLSHDSIIFDEKYDNLPGYDYLNVTYEIKKAVDPTLKHSPKVTVGYKTCRYAQFPDNEKGIIPKVLMQLLKARKSTRAKQKTENDKFKWDVLEGLQLAYKITANSLYGQIGARTSPIYLKDIAASTTATGRRLLLYARHYAEKNIEGCKCVYGDSVPGDEPILFKRGNEINIKTIEEIGDRYKWFEYENFKPNDNTLSNKQQCKPASMKVYVDNKWVNVKRLIRHNTQKKIYRVLMHSGCVDVTEDHSLINDSGKMIKPNECIPRETYIRESYPESNDNNLQTLCNIVKLIYETELDEEKQKYFMYGMFYGDGSTGIYDTKYGKKYTWAINNADIKLLEKCQRYMMSFGFKETDFKILDTLKSSGVYKLVPKGHVKPVVEHFMDFYNKNRYKIIPSQILNASTDNTLHFIVGYYAADGYKCFNSKTKNIRMSNKGKIGTAQLYYIFKKLGYGICINTRNDKPSIYDIKCCVGLCGKSKQRLPTNIVKKSYYLRDTYSDEYVYDIETECGWFTAGIGGMTLKNTDSIFVKFADKDGKPLQGVEGLQESIDKGIQIEKGIQMFYKKPHKLEYEKTFWPFILFTKKRYVGHLYETDVKKFKQKSMGIVLKRRDNAPIVKHVFGGVIKTIMVEKDIKKSVNFLRQCLYDLLEGKFDVNQLIISKTLKGYYKDPDSIAHKVLADRMAERDPGNKPQTNDRIPYVYIDVPEREGMLQGDKIEHLDYVKKNDLIPNYLHYITNQIMKPVSQIYELIVEKLDGYNKGQNYFKNKYKTLLDRYEGDEVKALSKLGELKRKEVCKLLFDDIIKGFINKKAGYSTMDNYISYVEKDDDEYEDIDYMEDDYEMEVVLKKTKKKPQVCLVDFEPLDEHKYDDVINKIVKEKGEFTVRKTMDISQFLAGYS